MLSKKVIALTGGGGGIGSEIAKSFATEGAIVYSLVLWNKKPSATGDPTSIRRLEVDLRKPIEIEKAFEIIKERHGHLDSLVVAAGIQLHGQDAAIDQVSLETWNRTIEINLTGAFLSIKYAMPLLIASGSGSLIIIGSPTGLTMSGAGYSAYSASKAGMMALSRIVAADYAKDGVRSNVIVPGTIVTPLIEDLISDSATLDQLLKGTPIGRLGIPQDLVGIANWLASDQSKFATGACFAIDGGLTAR